jgi:glycosyltransferase involved in cell wall biosynthesis
VKTGMRLLRERPYAFAVSHDYNVFYNGFGAFRLHRKTGLPYISEIHHVPGYPRAATFRERVDRFCTKRYTRWVQKHALAIRVVNGRELPGLLTRWGVDPSKIKVLHSLYLDLDTYCPLEKEKEYDLIFCGRLVPNKGIFILLEAMKILKQTRPDIRLMIVGRGPLRGRLEDFMRKARLEENVRFVEWVSESRELADLYRRSRFVVCTSYNEGGPRFTMEAMACGTPAVSTPVGIMSEVIRDGENGMLFEWNPEELAAKAGRMLSDGELYKRFQAGLPGIVAPFERGKVLSALADGFKSLVSGGE